jgi:serine/threonine protein phosphatase PrpC
MAARLGPLQNDETLGSIGAVCDQGLSSAHNEDAFAVATGGVGGERWWAMVVCDGISSASFSDRCARLAADAARDAIVDFATHGDLGQGVAAAITRSIQKAHAASCAITERQPGKDEPGTTIVVAFVHHQRVTVGWAGDSRAYWVTRLAAEPLTKDHSWAVETIERGEMSESEAMANPLAHAITRCIGPLEDPSPAADVHSSVKSRSIAGHGQVVLCSDGLWNYLRSDSELSTLLQSVADQAPIDRARCLVAHALNAGGRDNVTVVIADV